MAAHNDPFDDFILELDRPKVSSSDVLEAGLFLTGLRKRAQDDLSTAIMAAPPPSPYAVPVDQIVMHVAQIVSLLFDINGSGTFYGVTVDFCDPVSWEASSTARGLLKHVANLGAVNLPPVPGPLPVATKHEALSNIRAKAERLMLSLQNLRGLAGDSPFRFSVEEMLGRWSNILDGLISQERQASTEGGPEAKIARAIKIASIMEDPAALYQMRETQLQAAQVANENEFLRQELAQTQQHAALQQTEAEQLGAQTQQLGMQLEQAQMETQGAKQEAMANMELASSAESNAAAQADAKMRLSMRVQQLRQTLADIVSSDPAAEEGAGFEEVAGAGAPQTSVQQQQAADAEAQAAAEAGAAPGAAPGKAGKEVEEADRAATHAAVQEAQAEQQVGKTAEAEDPKNHRMGGGVAGMLIGARAGGHLGDMAGRLMERGATPRVGSVSRNRALSGAAGVLLGAGAGGASGVGFVRRAQESAVRAEKAKAAKTKTAGATERLLAADALDNATLNAIPEKQLKNIKGTGLAAKVRSAVGDSLEAGGQRVAKGFVNGVKANVKPDDVRVAGGLVAQGAGNALNKSAVEGEVAQHIARVGASVKKAVTGASRGAKIVGAGTLGLGAAGAGVLAYRGRAVERGLERGLKEQRSDKNR